MIHGGAFGEMLLPGIEVNSQGVCLAMIADLFDSGYGLVQSPGA